MRARHFGHDGPVSGGPRNHALDGLRGLAALAVLILHVWMFTEKRGSTPGELGRIVLGELRLGVVLFFVLSGFLLAGPWVAAALDRRPAPHLGRFALRRLARVGPGYWAAMVGALLLLQGAGPRYQPDLDELPLFALFAQNYFEHTRGRLDPPMWSLVVEVSFYVLLPLIGWAIVKARGRAGALGVCGLLVAFGLAWTAAGETWDWPLTAMTTLPVYLPVFACGIAAAVLAHGRSPGRGTVAALALAGAVAVALNALWHGNGTGFVGHVVLDLPAAAGFAAIVVAVAMRPGRLLGCPPLRWLGSISYGIYLWHMPVLVWLRVHGHLPPEDAVGGVLRVLVPTIVIASLSWLLIERPILRRVGRRGRPQPDRGQRRPQPAPAAA